MKWLTMSSPGSNAGPSSGLSRIPRGSACLTCRRRKMRCDGLRPFCTQCIRTNKQIDCEYTDGPNMSPTQVLEQEISRLQARIRELEHNNSPVATRTRTGTGTGMSTGTLENNDSTSYFDISKASGMNKPVSPLSVVKATSSHTSPSLSEDAQSLSPWSGSGESRPISPSNESATSFVDSDVEIVRDLVNSFLPHASQIGFFLNLSRFIGAAFIPNVQDRLALLPAALLDTVYLWGVHLSSDTALRTLEPEFVKRAVQSVSLSLALRSSVNIIHVIQAEILLCTYFFTTARFLEGRYHSSAAVALTMSCRLNKIRSSEPSKDISISGGFIQLPDPTDAVEEGERICGFWRVYILNQSWSVVLGSPLSIFDTSIDTQIDTPWPQEMEFYEQGGHSADFRSSMNMQLFLVNTIPDYTTDALSTLALRSKAIAIFARATELASTHRSANQLLSRQDDNILMMDNVIEQFIQILLPLELLPVPHDINAAYNLLITHTLARSATIQLHTAIEKPFGMQPKKDVFAAKQVVLALDIIDVQAVSFIDPIIAILWTIVCKTLISEISHIRSSQDSPLPSLQSVQSDFSQELSSSSVEAECLELIAMVQSVLFVMKAFSSSSSLMETQITKIREELDMATG